MITSIKQGSVIAKTNMEKGFIVTSVNNIEIDNIDDFIKNIINAETEVILDGFYEDYSGDFSYVFEK